METLELKESSTSNKVIFQNILLATDFSVVSRKALPYAAAIAITYGCKLSLVHVTPPEPRWPIPIEPEPPELRRDWLDSELAMKAFIAEDLVKGMRHEVFLERGPIRDVLSDLIQRNKIDLLVLGTRGRGGLKKLVLGSVAEQLFRSVECPVMTVGPGVPADMEDNRFHRILFATDFGPASLQALPHAISLAVEHKAKLTLLHVVMPMPVVDVGPYWYVGTDVIDREQKARREAIEKLESLIASDVKLPSDPEFIAALDYVPVGILKMADRCQADLVVMGVKRVASARTSAHLPWATAHEVVCRAKCPVLTVRA
jgi:nucleotide-binding universal stress UspA family protein